MRPLDVTGYLASIEECRHRFPSLRILSGVEAGEPHLFAGSVAAVLAAGSFDRVLGSLHALAWEGRQVNSSSLFRILEPAEVMRRYLAEVAALVEGSGAFEILAHLDYPRRHWPASAGPYAEAGLRGGVPGRAARAGVLGTGAGGQHLQPDGLGHDAALVAGGGRHGGVVRQRRARGLAGRRQVPARRWRSPRRRVSGAAGTRPTSGAAEAGVRARTPPRSAVRAGNGCRRCSV